MFSISFKNPSSLLAILFTLNSFNIPLTFKFVIISSLHSGIKDGRYILVFVTRSWYGTLLIFSEGSYSCAVDISIKTSNIAYKSNSIFPIFLFINAPRLCMKFALREYSINSEVDF